MKYSTNSDFPDSINPFVEKVEYDAICAYGAGVRLYLTGKGKIVCAGITPGSIYMTTTIANWIRSQPEWIGDRSHTFYPTPSHDEMTHISFFTRIAFFKSKIV